MSATTDLTPDTNQELGEHELCTQCLTGNAPGIHFCGSCGAPLTSYAATGPFESLFAEGHLYHKAAEQPRRLIVVVGMWLIFGMMGVSGATTALMHWNSRGRVGVLVGAALLSISLLLITKTTKNYRNRRLNTNERNG